MGHCGTSNAHCDQHVNAHHMSLMSSSDDKMDSKFASKIGLRNVFSDFCYQEVHKKKRRLILHSLERLCSAMRQLMLRRCNQAYAIMAFLSFAIFYYSIRYNVIEYARTVPFKYFSYPLEVDLQPIVEKVLNGQPAGVQPLNDRYAYPFVLNADRKCKDEDGSPEPIFLLILIKSRIENFEQRHMIRRTWAREYGVTTVTIRRVFLVGVTGDTIDKTWQHRLGVEQQDYNDIVQQYFIDSYFNNTLKMIMGFQWATQFCDTAKFIAFFDDDYFVNMNRAVSVLQSIKPTEMQSLIIGYVWKNAMPYRIKDSKWYISLDEYPYRYYPSYVTAGSFFIPMPTVDRLYAGMQFTKIIRFDDVYLGIVAWKLRVRLRHNANLYYYDFPYGTYRYRKVIAAHGFHDPELLYRAWKEQTKLDELS